GIGGLGFRELGIHVVIAGREVELGGALLENLVLNHAFENFETPDVGLFLRDILLLIGLEIGLVDFLEIGAHDVFAIDGGDDVGAGSAMAAGNGENNCKAQ